MVEQETSLRGTKQSAQLKTQPLIPELRFKEFDGEWKENFIGKFSNVNSGYTFSRKYQGLSNEKWLYLKVADIGIASNTKYLKTAINTVSEDILKKMKARPFRKGCIVFPRVGAALLNNNKKLLYEDSIIDDNVLAVDIFESKKYDDEFIYYWFLTKHLSMFCNNGQIPVISATRVKSHPVLAPLRSEQQKIASFLSAVDEKIQQLTQKKSLLEQYKKGVMQQLFSGKLRFKDENGEDFPDWEEKRLGDIIEFSNGKGHEQSIDKGGKFIVVNSKFISTKGRVKKYCKTQISPLNKGDIVMVMSDVPNGKALAKCLIIDKANRYTLNQRICSLKAKSVINQFLIYILNRNKYYLSFDSGVGQTNLKKNEVLNCPLFIPTSLKEQQKIANYLSAIDTKIETVNQQIEKTQAFKKGLLQQMFV